MRCHSGVLLVALVAAVLLLSGCASTPSPTPLPYNPPPQPSPSVTGLAAGPTDTPPTATPSPYPQVMCTPPLCRADEVFHCPDSCPGGCGTECATRTPTPTLLPGQNRLDLNGPVLVDSARGLLYVPGWPDGRPGDSYEPDTTELFILDARDGRVLASVPITGTVALDASHGYLVVDQGVLGMSVLDAATLQVHEVVSLPSLSNDRERSPAPIADPATGTALAFRNNMVYVVDPQKGVVAQEIPFDVRKDGGSCSTFEGPLAIDRAYYDSARHILYAAFLTYTCTPWYGYTIVAHEMASGKEIARWGSLPFTATAADGRLYGSSWHRFGIGYHWIWQDGQFTTYSANWGGGGFNGFTIDRRRGWVYEATPGDLRVYDAETMTLEFAIPKPAGGLLAAMNPATDTLYFLEDGKLHIVSASAIQPPSAEPLLSMKPPVKPVTSLFVSSGWPADGTLFSAWGGEILLDGCYVFGQMARLPLISTDGGNTWGQPVGGLRGACGQATTIALSPDYPNDKTLFAVIVGLGPYKSTDGGRLWQPISRGLADVGLQNLLVSPDYAADQTLFGQASGEKPGMVFKSTDGGRIWSQLPETNLNKLALSPEYGQDRTLIAATGGEQPELKISRDGGYAWETLGDAPGGGVSMLSLAPLFQKWETVFVLSSNGSLYRSWIGGSRWDPVLQTLPNAQIASMAYGPSEEHRSVFLVVATQTDPSDALSFAGVLYRSDDGGLHWESVPLPEGVQPTAAAFSPDLAGNGVLFVGTADGRVQQIPIAE